MSQELFRLSFLTVTPIDVLDMAVVAFLIYKLYAVMRGTIAAQIFVGLVLIFSVSVFVNALNMSVLGSILRTLIDVWVLAFLILFQPELRRLLSLVGQSRLVSRFVPAGSEATINAVVEAVRDMATAPHPVGALIVFVRETGIRTYIETGDPIHADVTKRLLISIFWPKSPLHDGAVIIAQGKIAAARCILPLSANVEIGVNFGMRHRAALGVSELADVLVVVVSEETGRISIAEDGILRAGLTIDELRRRLVLGLKVSRSLTPNAAPGSAGPTPVPT